MRAFIPSRMSVIVAVSVTTLATIYAMHCASANAYLDCPSGVKAFKGTITVHSGLPQDCVVTLPGGVVLRAGGGTAPLGGRAIFRVSGSGIGGPGGLSIAVDASDSPLPTASELVRELSADAVITVPHGASIQELNPALGVFVQVSGRHVRWATLYKVLLTGASPVPLVQRAQPAALPATGSGFLILPAIFGAGLVLLAGSWTVRQLPQRLKRVVIVASGLVCLGSLVHEQPGTAIGSQSVNQGPRVRSDAGSTLPPDRLMIPAVSIDAKIVETVPSNGVWQVPTYAAGYLSSTAWPGHNGNLVLSGHEDGYGSVFASLAHINRGDKIYVQAGTRIYTYSIVTSQIVDPRDIAVLHPTTGATLTLITCTPYGLDTQRYVAHAVLVSH